MDKTTAASRLKAAAKTGPTALANTTGTMKRSQSFAAQAPQPKAVTPAGIVRDEVRNINSRRKNSPTIQIAAIKDGAFDYVPENTGYENYLKNNAINPFKISVNGILDEDVRPFLFKSPDTTSQKSIDSLAGPLRYAPEDLASLRSNNLKKTAESFIDNFLSGQEFESAGIKELEDAEKRTTLHALKAKPEDIALLLLKRVAKSHANIKQLPKSAAKNLLLNEFNLIVEQIKYITENAPKDNATFAKSLANEVRQKFQAELDKASNYPRLVWDQQKAVVSGSGSMNFALTRPSRAPFQSNLLIDPAKSELEKTVFASWQHVALDAFEQRLGQLKSKLQKKAVTPDDLRVAAVKLDGATGQGKTFLIDIIKKHYGNQINITSIDLNSSPAKVAQLKDKKAATSTATSAKAEVVVIDEIYFQGEDFLKSVGKDKKDLEGIEFAKEEFVRELAAKGVLVVLAGATENPEIYDIAHTRIQRKAKDKFQLAELAQDSVYAEQTANSGKTVDLTKLRELQKSLFDANSDTEKIQQILLNNQKFLQNFKVASLFPNIEDRDLKRKHDDLERELNTFAAHPNSLKTAQDLSAELLKSYTPQNKGSMMLALESATQAAQSAIRKAEQKTRTAKNMRAKREAAKDKVNSAVFTKDEDVTKYRSFNADNKKKGFSTLYILPDISVKEFSEADFKTVSSDGKFVVVTPCFIAPGTVSQELGYKIWYKEAGQIKYDLADKDKVASACLKIEETHKLPRIILYDKTTAVGGDVGSLALDVEEVFVQCDAKDKSYDDVVQFYGRYRGDKPNVQLNIVSNVERAAFLQSLANNTLTQDEYRLQAYLKNKSKSKEAETDRNADKNSVDQQFNAAKDSFELGTEGRREAKALLEENERQRRAAELEELRRQEELERANLALFQQQQALKLKQLQDEASRDTALQTEASRVAAEIEKMQQERDNLEKAMQEEIAKLEAERARRLADLERQRKELEEQQDQPLQSQIDLQALQDERDRLAREAEEQRQRIANEKAVREKELKAQADQLQKEIDAKAAELAGLKNQNVADVDDSAAARAEAELARIQDELQQAQRANEEKARAAAAEASQRKQEHEAQVAKLRAQLAAAQAFKAPENSQLSADELTNLQGDLEKAERKNKTAEEAARKAAEEAEQRLAQLRAQEEEAKKQLAAKEAAIAAARDAEAAALAAAQEKAKRTQEALRAKNAELAKIEAAAQAALQAQLEEEERARKALEEKERELELQRSRLEQIAIDAQQKAEKDAAALAEAEQKALKQVEEEKAARERAAAAAASAAAAIAAAKAKITTPSARPGTAPVARTTTATTFLTPRPASAGAERKRDIDHTKLTDALTKGAQFQFSSTITHGDKDAIDRAHTNGDEGVQNAKTAENGRKNALFRNLVGALKKIDSQLEKSTDAEKLLTEIWDKDSVSANPNALTTAQKSSLLIFCGALTMDDDDLKNFVANVKNMNLNRKCATTPALKDLVLDSLKTIKDFSPGLVSTWINDTNEDLKGTRNNEIPDRLARNPAAKQLMTNEVVKGSGPLSQLPNVDVGTGRSG